MKRRTRKREIDSTEYLVCKHCGIPYKAITWSHLFYRHGKSSPHPIFEYKGDFQLRWAHSQATRRKLRASLIQRFKELGRRWTRRRVLAEVRRLNRAGQKLRMKTVPCSLYQAARNVFGTWQAAVEKAGLAYEDVSGVHHWTRAKVIQKIRQLADDGQPLFDKWVKRRHGALYKAAKVYLNGSWGDALAAAGFDRSQHRMPRTAWNEAKARAWVEKRMKIGRPVVAASAPQDLKNFVRLRLKTNWTEFIESFGIDYPGVRQRRGYWTRAVVLDEIRRWKAQEDPAHPRAVTRHYSALHNQVRKFFGSWEKGCRAAGVDPHSPRLSGQPRGRWTKDKVLAWVKKRIARGGSLLVKDIPGDLHNFVVYHFDKNWTEFVESFGVTYPGFRPRRSFWTKEKLIDEIRRWAAEGHRTNVKSVSREYQSLLHQARKYYKSWDTARAAAGVEVTRAPRGAARRFTPEELLEAIRQWKAAGNLTNQNTVQSQNFTLLYYGRKYFKTWRGACAAAGVEVTCLPRHPPPRWTPQELLDEIRRWKAAGHLTNQDSVNRENRTLLTYAFKYFKTWRAACAAAGVEVDKLPRGGAARKNKPMT